jgi:hypothetical protein
MHSSYSRFRTISISTNTDYGTIARCKLTNSHQRHVCNYPSMLRIWEIYHCRNEILGYDNNEMSIVMIVNESKSSSMSRTSKQSFVSVYSLYRNRNSVLIIETGYRAWRPRGRSSSPGGGKNFHFSMLSRPALGFTQPPTQWMPGALSPGVNR